MSPIRDLPREPRTRLDDGVVRIRRHEPSDADALYEAVRASIDEVAPWLPWCHEDYSREESASWLAERPDAWARGEAYSFAVEDAGTGRFLGGVGINQIAWIHRVGNLGYWMRTDATGRGLTTRAARLAVLFAREDLGLVRVEILAAVENRPSQRVAEKLGATREGVLRKRLHLRGEPRDAVLFGLVEGDAIPEPRAG